MMGNVGRLDEISLRARVFIFLPTIETVNLPKFTLGTKNMKNIYIFFSKSVKYMLRKGDQTSAYSHGAKNPKK